MRWENAATDHGSCCEKATHPEYAGRPSLSAAKESNGMTEKTIFKKIIDGEIPADIIYEDELCMAFNDVSPQAPVHVLIIPKKEIRSIATVEPEDQLLMGHLLLTVRRLAEDLKLDNGFRTIINTGEDGGQTVFHLHIHLMGQRALAWPPG